jgi:hypothetical protein
MGASHVVELFVFYREFGIMLEYFMVNFFNLMLIL